MRTGEVPPQCGPPTRDHTRTPCRKRLSPHRVPGARRSHRDAMGPRGSGDGAGLSALVHTRTRPQTLFWGSRPKRQRGSALPRQRRLTKSYGRDSAEAAGTRDRRRGVDRATRPSRARRGALYRSKRRAEHRPRQAGATRRFHAHSCRPMGEAGNLPPERPRIGGFPSKRRRARPPGTDAAA